MIDSGLVGREFFFFHHIRLVRSHEERRCSILGPTRSRISPSILEYTKINTGIARAAGGEHSVGAGDLPADALLPYTIHPSPYTLHPTPHTLHITPYTLHPTPYTLHSHPTPLNPTPHTPHPKQ